MWAFICLLLTTYRTHVFLQNPSALAKVQEELDRVLGGRKPQFADIKELKYLTRCINESMRIYPHPPVCDPHHS
jgi:carotene epsilon-monooxygenase